MEPAQGRARSRNGRIGESDHAGVGLAGNGRLNRAARPTAMTLDQTKWVHFVVHVWLKRNRLSPASNLALRQSGRRGEFKRSMSGLRQAPR